MKKTSFLVINIYILPDILDNIKGGLMERKILAILVSILFITMIPSVIGVNSESEDREPCLDIGRYFTRGLLFDPPFNSEPNLYFAIWLFYPTEEGVKLIILDWVTLNISLGRWYEVGLGLFIFVFGFFEGGLEIE